MTHGVISRYHAGCRCADCKRASRKYRARYRTPVGTRYTPQMCPFCGEWFYALGVHEPACAV